MYNTSKRISARCVSGNDFRCDCESGGRNENGAGAGAGVSEEFPQASNIPFPYPHPYPQQLDLMDTLLQSLQQLQDRGHDGEGTGTGPGHCPVFLLESPTGTGKSLSLACAAMAWLRHVEHGDLKGGVAQQPEREQDCIQPKMQEKAFQFHRQAANAACPSTTSTTSGSSTARLTVSSTATSASTTTTTPTATTDWIQAWIPPEQLASNDTERNMRHHAVQARRKLQQALQSILQQTTQPQPDCRDHQNMVQDNHPATMGMLSTTGISRSRSRAHVLVSTILQQQQQQPLSIVSRAKRSRPPMPIQLEYAKDHLCLDDYQSDPECSHPRYDSLDDHIDNDDIEGDGEGENNHHNAHDRRRMRRSTASMLLYGPHLDGSAARGLSQRLKEGCTIPSAAIGQVVPGSGVRKIIYAARTHSQLSQFVQELRRTAWKDSVRVVALGGRSNLCGNSAVVGRTRHSTYTATGTATTIRISEASINETCLDLQKGIRTSHLGGTNKENCAASKRDRGGMMTNSTKGCPLLTSRAVAVETLALHMLAQPTDIEEAAQLGQSAQACAYYATRAALPAAEVVVLPYHMLLSKQVRSSIGLSLQGSLVLIDEAHNLPEVLRSLHSSRLSLPVVEAALSQLHAYTTRYLDRLAGRNIVYLTQIRKILLSFQKHLKTPQTNKVASEAKRSGMVTACELLLQLKIDNLNLFKILRYLVQSRLAQKLLGFRNATSKDGCITSDGAAPDDVATAIADFDRLSKHVSAMSVVQIFLEKLTLSGTEGKVVTDWPVATSDGADLDDLRSRRIKHPTLRYVLLHPAKVFENVIQEAHAVALVGGTLRPFVHVASELLGNQSIILAQAAEADGLLQQQMETFDKKQHSGRLITKSFSAFSCHHVVPSSHTLLQCIAQGPTGQLLDFRHQSRCKDVICDEMGRSLVHLCQKAPSGVVVFLPSYRYESILVQRWQGTGMWQELQKYKKIHREPKSSQHVEASLTLYSGDAMEGAVLLCVVGGKMSEGINFSDHMARAVVVVGLPYPDISDAELQEKMSCLDQSSQSSTMGGATGTTITGQDYYRNLCMRAVNQSIGRAIRHANDYAAILLFDSRYTTNCRIQERLPTWLTHPSSDQWRQDLPFPQRMHELESFYASHNVQN